MYLKHGGKMTLASLGCGCRFKAERVGAAILWSHEREAREDQGPCDRKHTLTTEMARAWAEREAARIYGVVEEGRMPN